MHEHVWGSDTGQEAEEARELSEYLLRIGDGREPTFDDIGKGIVWVPNDICMLEPSQTLKGLISEIYGDLAHCQAGSAIHVRAHHPDFGKTGMWTAS